MRTIVAVLVAFLISSAVSGVQATTVAAVQTASGSSVNWRGTIGANQSATIGWSFTVGAQDVELDALGFYDDGADGNVDAHAVGIWTNAGALLAQATVSAGTASTLVGSYRYAAVTPVTLLAGQTYVIGTYFGPVVDLCSGSACGDVLLYSGSETYNPRISFTQSRQTLAIAGAGSLAFPNVDAGVAQGFFGPNFLLAADTTPDAFVFTAQTGVALSSTVTSNTITVAGIDAPSAISIVGGTYSINGGGYVSGAGTVSNGDTVTVRQTSSGSFSTLSTATLTIGGVSAAFNATTQALDTTPDAFAFTAQTGVARSSTVTSNAITVAGINAASPITIVGGTYAINGGGYVSGAGTVSNGDTVTVRQTSSGSFSTLSTATLTIGGVNAGFGVTTQGVPAPSIPLLSLPAGCGVQVAPPIVNLSQNDGPAFVTDMVAMLAGALGMPLQFVEQTACGSVNLSGYGGGKLAFTAFGFQTGDGRANGVYALGDGRYQVVRGGQSLTLAPALVHLEQLVALFPGMGVLQGENGVFIANIGGLTYVVQPGVAVQLDPATGNARLVMGADGYWHFIDASGNNQTLYPAFADVNALRNALRGLDAGATLSIQLDATASVVLNGQRLALVPDLNLSPVPRERVGQYWWQESALRFWLVNSQPLGTVQGLTQKP